MKDQFGFEGCLTSAATEYAYAEKDHTFTEIVRVSCDNGKADATVITPDAFAEEIALSAIAQYTHAPGLGRARWWAEHNRSAFEIAKLAAQIAAELKGGK